MGKEAKSVEAVIDSDYDHAFAGEDFALVGGGGAGAASKPATVDPHHHRQTVLCGFRGGPNVEVEAILAERRKFALINRSRGRVRRLPAGIGELRGLANALPGGRRLRRFPTEIAHRRRSKGYAAVNAHVGMSARYAGNQTLLAPDLI